MTDDWFILPNVVAPPSELRRMLSVALTEADILRALIKISEKLQRERQRLRDQKEAAK